jgi:hypothetical protein
MLREESFDSVGDRNIWRVISKSEEHNETRLVNQIVDEGRPRAKRREMPRPNDAPIKRSLQSEGKGPKYTTIKSSEFIRSQIIWWCSVTAASKCRALPHLSFGAR